MKHLIPAEIGNIKLPNCMETICFSSLLPSIACLLRILYNLTNVTGKGCWERNCYMARPSKFDSMNIADLERILSERKSAATRLTKQRKDIQKKLDAIDRKLDKLGASGRRTAGGRARNEKSLPETLAEVLSNGKPMKVGAIADAVLATGYRSSSPNFRAIVNQTLIKERKRFAPSGERGTYQLKK